VLSFHILDNHQLEWLPLFSAARPLVGLRPVSADENDRVAAVLVCDFGESGISVVGEKSREAAEPEGVGGVINRECKSKTG
jgi:hypothetical protein